MQDSANVSLSSFEKELVTNTEWILTKNLILQKVNILFHRLSNNYCNEQLVQHFPDEVKNILPKISKGENYQGLPWMMLDYPRFFSKQDVFAVRTFFWWGNFFSITLHLKGKYKIQFEKNITKKINLVHPKNAWININDNEWAFDFDSTSMQLLQPEDHRIKKQIALRLGFKMNLHQWDDAEEFLSAKFNQLVQLLF